MYRERATRCGRDVAGHGNAHRTGDNDRRLPTLQGEPALDHQPTRNWSVVVRSDAKVVATTSTDEMGRFIFALVPGTYQVNCLGGRTFEVQAGQTTKANCDVPVR